MRFAVAAANDAVRFWPFAAGGRVLVMTLHDLAA